MSVRRATVLGPWLKRLKQQPKVVQMRTYYHNKHRHEGSLFSRPYVPELPPAYAEVDQATLFNRVVRHLKLKSNSTDLVLYITCVAITFVGLSFASSPMYRLLCQRFGWAGTIDRRVKKKLQSLSEWRESETALGRNRKFLIRFDTRTGAGMPWDFEPVQSYVVTRPGESTLAFFAATNHASVPMTGLSTYTVLPFKAAPHFVKIQCFCFEEQRLRGNETVDMPVLFFLDPKICEDRRMGDIDEITLSYIFYPVTHEEDDFIEEDDFDADSDFWFSEVGSDEFEISENLDDSAGVSGGLVEQGERYADDGTDLTGIKPGFRKLENM